MLAEFETVWLHVNDEPDAVLPLLTASLTGSSAVEGDVEVHTSPFIPAIALTCSTSRVHEAAGAGEAEVHSFRALGVNIWINAGQDRAACERM